MAESIPQKTVTRTADKLLGEGYDASRGVTAMGHNVLCAAVVTRRRAMPLCMRLLRGRHGTPD